jgi:hypothetical protein
MKKFLVFLFVRLIFSATAQTMAAGMKTDLKPGIEFVQGQIEAPVYEAFSTSPAVVFDQDTPIEITSGTMCPEDLYSDCRKTLMPTIDAASELSPGLYQVGILQVINKDETELYSTCNKRLAPGSLSLERSFKTKSTARQRAILNRKFPG